MSQQGPEHENPHAHHGTRPWGSWQVLLDEPDYKVKRLVVLPGKRLSEQKHFRREEHWTVVQGQGQVTLDTQQTTLGIGGTINIPLQAWHRLENTGTSELVVIEVQCGTYFGEDDIVRRADDFGRAN